MTRMVSSRHLRLTRPAGMVSALSLVVGFTVAFVAAAPATAAAPTVLTFNYTAGSQLWTVPAGITSATFDVSGAAGGEPLDNGLGGESVATLPVTAGQIIEVMVGGQGGAIDGGCIVFGGACVRPAAGGFNGGDGAPAGGAGGGGASDVRTGGSPYPLSSRVIVAGGGGGGWSPPGGVGVTGGAGGGLAGGISDIPFFGPAPCGSGSGGNQDGTSGSGMLGNAGYPAACSSPQGGGGGGGYFGGADGYGGPGVFGGGGGGGSGFTHDGTGMSTGVRSGNGVVTVSFAPESSKIPQDALTITSTAGTVGTPLTLTTGGGSGVGGVTYTAVDGTASGCTVSPLPPFTLSVTGTGTCTVTASKAGDATYLPASTTATVTFAPGVQAPLTLTSTSGTYLTPLTLTTSGGTGSGVVTYAATNGTATGCTVSGSAPYTLSTTSAGTCSVTATKAGDSSYPAPVSSVPTTVTLGKANQTALTITSLSGTVGASPLMLTTSGGSGTGAVTYTAVNGTATGCAVSTSAPYTLSVTGVGTCTVTATKSADGNFNAQASAPTAVTFTVGPPYTIALSGYADGSVAADHIHTLTATVRDQYGNGTPDYAGTLTVTTTDPQAVLPGPITVTNGTALIPIELRTAGVQTISVSDSSSPALTGSLTVSLAPAALARLVLTPSAPSVVAGQPTQLTVTAQDAYGNVLTDDNAPVAVTGSDPIGSQPDAVTLSSGTATFTVIGYTAGTDTITVSAGSVTGTSALRVVPGPATTLALTGLPTELQGGAPLAIAITALDAPGNVVTSDADVITLTTTDTRAFLPASVSLVDGVAHVALSLRTAGDQTLTASTPDLSVMQSTHVQRVPSAPRALVAVAEPGQVSVSWSVPRSDGAATFTGYDVFMSRRSGHKSATPLNAAPITDTTYTATGLRNGVTYYFIVRAINVVGMSARSAEASATTPVTAPLVPTALTADATLGAGILGLSWTPPRWTGGSDILGYNLYVGTRTGQESITPVNTNLITGTSFTISGLQRGKHYFFRVRAVNVVGASAASRQISAIAP